MFQMRNSFKRFRFFFQTNKMRTKTLFVSIILTENAGSNHADAEV